VTRHHERDYAINAPFTASFGGLSVAGSVDVQGDIGAVPAKDRAHGVGQLTREHQSFEFISGGRHIFEALPVFFQWRRQPHVITKLAKFQNAPAVEGYLLDIIGLEHLG